MNDIFEIESGVLLSCSSEESTINIPYGIHTIGEGVFKGKAWIEKIILPDTVKVIKANAFKGCRKLKEINFPDGLEKIEDFAFHRCHCLEEAILPDSVCHLGQCAFLYCDKMRVVSLKGIKKLYKQTFANCTELCEIHLNSEINTENLNDDIFTGCVKINRICLSDGQDFTVDNLISAISSDTNIHPTVKAVAKGVYNSMKLENGTLYKFFVNLKDFSLPEGITCIEKSCFFDKKGIFSVTLPESLDRIKANAFGNCINLEKIKIQNRHIKIDEKAFKGCCNLSEVILWDGKTYSLRNFLTEKNVPDIIRNIAEQILSDFYISGKTLMKYRGKEERVTVPEGIKVIAESCFEGNEAVGRVILPDTVSEIRENAFKGCTVMQTIALSENLTVIEKSAFENCHRLLKITLPNKTEKIGESSFKRCFKLNCFQTNDRLSLIEDMAFYGCRELKEINIPKNTQLNGTLIFYNSGINSEKYIHSDSIKENKYPLKYIEPYKFCKDKNIRTLKITEPCIIGKYAFSNCKNLAEIEINCPSCIVEEHAFEKCTSLISVKINARSVGKYAFAFCGKLENAVISLNEKISEYAFFECESLKNIKLSEEITVIEKRCFERCISLKNFDTKNIKVIGERAFAGCDGLENMKFHDMQINYHAFEDCSNLKSISVSSDTVLKSGAFFGCTNIDEINIDGHRYNFHLFSQSINSIANDLPENVQEIIADIYLCFDISETNELIKYKGNAVSVKIPDDIISIYDEAFRNCIRLDDISIPESVKFIGKLSFAGTGWLGKMKIQNSMTVVNGLLIDASSCGKYAEIPAEIKHVCSWAFSGNSELREVKFLGNRTAVDEFAFRNCFNLKKMTDSDGNIYELDSISVRENKTLPAHIRKIFTDCINCFKTDENGNLIESTGNIKDLVFVKGIRAINAEVYKDCNLLETIMLSDDTEFIGKSAFENSKWLREVKNAVGVKRIENMAFSGCQSLETAEFSEKLEYIGKRCFEHCCKLREIIIPEGITEIQERSFFRCKSLRKIILPSTLRTIGKEAFLFCEMLEEVIFKNENVNIEERAFGGTRFEIQKIR